MELTIEDVAGRAGVDVAYVRRLIDLGALGPERVGYREQDAHVTALLHMCEEAGLTAESILTAADAGDLHLARAGHDPLDRHLVAGQRAGRPVVGHDAGRDPDQPAWQINPTIFPWSWSLRTSPVTSSYLRRLSEAHPPGTTTA